MSVIYSSILWVICFTYAHTADIISVKSHGYEIKFMQMPVDHFGYSSTDKFQLRYLVSTKHWTGDGSPIFFYTGNEGDITWFCNNTGLLWDWALHFDAMVVFAEHRYYGASLPYGNQTFKDVPHRGYLTSEQALADFADLITAIKSTASNSPVIAFGGSYGGMLSAWMRLKYPHIVQGSLAASAPVLWFGDLTPCNAFSEILTRDFSLDYPNCASNINNSWAIINKFAKDGLSRAKMASLLRLCQPLESEAEALALKSWIKSVLTMLAMVNYPYPANFLQDLPAWPVKEFCAPLRQPVADEALLTALANSLDVYFNFTGRATCYNTTASATPSLGEQGWGFQACTEMVMPMCSNGVTDMFEPEPWNLTSVVNECIRKYNVSPRPDWIEVQYGGRNISSASNIIFSNGLLDPWSAGGVLHSLSDTLVAILIKDGAHHLDLRHANQDDPDSVIQARHQEKLLVHSWILRYQRSLEPAEDDTSWTIFGWDVSLNADAKLQSNMRPVDRRMLLAAVVLTLMLCVAALLLSGAREFLCGRTRVYRHAGCAAVAVPSEILDKYSLLDVTPLIDRPMENK